MSLGLKLLVGLNRISKDISLGFRNVDETFMNDLNDLRSSQFAEKQEVISAVIICEGGGEK